MPARGSAGLQPAPGRASRTGRARRRIAMRCSAALRDPASPVRLPSCCPPPRLNPIRRPLHMDATVFGCPAPARGGVWLPPGLNQSSARAPCVRPSGRLQRLPADRRSAPAVQARPLGWASCTALGPTRPRPNKGQGPSRINIRCESWPNRGEGTGRANARPGSRPDPGQDPTRVKTRPGSKLCQNSIQVF